MQETRADIAIIGGGVIGASALFFLAKKGLKPLLLEAKSIAHGASGKAGGILTPFAPSETPEIKELLGKSLQIHDNLAKEFDGENHYAYKKYRALTIATTLDEVDQLRKTRLNSESQWLENEEILQEKGWINKDTYGGISFTNYQLDPEAFTRKLVAESLKMGARIELGRVINLLKNKNRIAGLETKSGIIRTEKVIFTMGPWTINLENWLGVKIPVIPLKGEILRMQIPNTPAGGFSDIQGNYVLTRPNGIVFAGTTEDYAGFDTHPTQNGKDRILKSLSRYTDHLKEGAIVDHTACLRPLSADGLPFIDQIPNINGAYIATGHGRKGIALGPATGESISELVTTGRSTSLDNFRLDRPIKTIKPKHPANVHELQQDA